MHIKNTDNETQTIKHQADKTKHPACREKIVYQALEAVSSVERGIGEEERRGKGLKVMGGQKRLRS
jgi:hypothetical protein